MLREEQQNTTPLFVETGVVLKDTYKKGIEINALGSCVALIAYNRSSGYGAAAHIMLPGKAPQKEQNKNKYAHNAVKKLLSLIVTKKSGYEDLTLCIVGGANVLKRKNCTIAPDNVKSVIEELSAYGLKVLAQKTGGTKRYRVYFDTRTGKVYYARGSSDYKALINYQEVL